MRLSPTTLPWTLTVIALAACGASRPPDAVQADSARAPSAAEARPPAPVAAAPVAVGSAAQEIRSVRTTLREEDCTTVSVDEEGGGSTQRCPGTAGHSLLVLDGDARISITLVAPDGSERPLDYWTTVTGGFSSVGEQAEWRVRGSGASAAPVALIVLLKASEHDDATGEMRPVSYRVIAKITPTETCVVHRLPGETPDAEVRRLADASAAAPCRTSYDEP